MSDIVENGNDATPSKGKAGVWTEAEKVSILPNALPYLTHSKTYLVFIPLANHQAIRWQQRTEVGPDRSTRSHNQVPPTCLGKNQDRSC
jgi:hypothetical protein